MFNFGLEITSVLSGTTCPETVAQYHRNIQTDLQKWSIILKKIEE